MVSKYKQSYLMVMEDGSIIKWTGYAEDKNHGEGLAIEYATNRDGSHPTKQVWDMCNRPILS